MVPNPAASWLLVKSLILIQHFRWGSFPEAVVTLVSLRAVLKGVGLIVALHIPGIREKAHTLPLILGILRET